MDFHRIGVKWLARESVPLDLLELIPVFHRWIQDSVLGDLLIDVAEYTHMHHGPGVLIIAHEGNYGYDETGGERGLLYYSKQPLPESDLASRLAHVARKGLKACVLFEREPGIGKHVSFPGDRLEVFANDRLLAPNTDEGWAEFLPAVKSLGARLFPNEDHRIERLNTDPRDRLTAVIRAATAPGAETLLARLS